MTASRDTMENLLRDLEETAEQHAGDPTWRARKFRTILNAAWADGQERGYNDCSDDHGRVAATARRAAREAAKESGNG